MTRSASLAGAQEFVRGNVVVLVLSALAMVLAYGFALTSFALSIDEDTAFYVDWTDNWIRQGRPGIPLLKFLIADSLAMPFFNMALALALLFVAGVWWAFLFSHAAGPGRVGRSALLVFLVVFTTLPVNAYYLAFNTLNVEVSLAWAFAAGSVWLAWLWAMEDRGWLAFAASTVLALIAMLTFQDLTFTIISGVLIVQLAYLLGHRKQDGLGTREAIRQTVSLSLPIVGALVVTAVASLVFIERGGRIESLIMWGADEPGLILRRILLRIGAFATGSGFQGGWVLVPTIAAGVLLLALLVTRGLRKRQWYPLALLLLISIMPFGLWIAIGQPLPNRSMQALVLVAASVWLLLALVIHARRQLAVAFLVGAALFTIWNGGIITRSFITEHQTYETDRAIAREIGERLVRAGWDGTVLVPIVTIGERAQGPLELVSPQEFMGLSLYNDIDGRRSPGFMTLMGYPMRSASRLETEAAQERGRSMPSWPAEGAVVFEDGLAIVKFSDFPRATASTQPRVTGLIVRPATEPDSELAWGVPAVASSHSVTISESLPGCIVVEAVGEDPQVSMAVPDGMALRATATEGGLAQVFVDFGTGYSQTESARLIMTTEPMEIAMQAGLDPLGWSIRLDPPDGQATTVCLTEAGS